MPPSNHSLVPAYSRERTMRHLTQHREGFERGLRAIVFAANRHNLRTGRFPLRPRQTRP